MIPDTPGGRNAITASLWEGLQVWEIQKRKEHVMETATGSEDGEGTRDSRMELEKLGKASGGSKDLRTPLVSAHRN